MSEVPAALIALLVSMAFTLYAVRYPDAANIVAAPVALVAIVLLWLSRRETRG